MIESILAGAAQYGAALSPIDMFNVEQRQKLAGLGTRAQASFAAGHVKNQLSRGAGEGVAGLTDYFTGRYVGESMASAPGNLRFRSMARRATAVGAGLYFGGQMLFGNDNLVSNTIGFGAKVGMHGVAAAGLAKYVHPLAGAAYAGLGLLNMFKSGNNLGPF